MAGKSINFYKNHKFDICKCCICKARRGETKGVNNSNYNNKWSNRKKKQFSLKRLGINNPFYGKKQTKLHRKSIKRGSDNHLWIDGRTKLISQIRNLEEYKNWRLRIFERDNYICQECFNKGYLEAHHMKSFSILLGEFIIAYNQFSPIEDKEILTRLAITYKPFWDITNGMTLCKKCHDLTKEGRKNGKK